MPILIYILLGQCVFVMAVVFILKMLLDKELMQSALEKFGSCKDSHEIKEIVVCSASKISEALKSDLESIRKNKMPQANFNFLEDPSLKGGIVIKIGDTLLDFSLQSRLQHFWS